MTVKELINTLEDKHTPLYLSYETLNTDESTAQQVKLNPRCELLCEAFNDYVVESILPIGKEDEGNDYGGALVVRLKTKIELIKQIEK